MPLTETQSEALNDYLGRHPKTCEQCGGSEWKGEGIVAPLKTPMPESEIRKDHVEIVCAACGEKALIDCEAAGVRRI